MKLKRLIWLIAGILAGYVAAPLWGASFYTLRPDDPKALYLTRDDAGVHGDGVADDTDAIQSAINKIQETTVQGILFIPEGRYRISKTVIVWPGIRLIGYGTNRPVFVLGKDTPGYQDGIGYMMLFAGGRPASGSTRPASNNGRVRPSVQGIVPPNNSIPDANPGTFYSAMSNIDIEIQDGNPAAVGIRFHVAQHCYLSHMDFHIGSGLAALHDVGNEAEDLHFYGGQYGIMTRKPSPDGSLRCSIPPSRAKARPPSKSTRPDSRSSAISFRMSLPRFQSILAMPMNFGSRTLASKTSAALRSSSATRTTPGQRSISKTSSAATYPTSPAFARAAKNSTEQETSIRSRHSLMASPSPEPDPPRPSRLSTTGSTGNTPRARPLRHPSSSPAGHLG